MYAPKAVTGTTMTTRRENGLEIRQSAAGRGVFATAAIAAGSAITRFKGPYLRYAQTTPQTYALQIGLDLYLGASGGVDDYFNHCCEPNAGLKIFGTTVELVAIRDIEAGEEIRFDYSTTLDEEDFEFDCLCGAEGCRGRVRDGKYLPEGVWQKYLRLGIVPDYVVRSREQLGRK